MTLEDKLEEACNKFLETGKMPGVACLNRKTLTALAQEFEPKERIVIPEDYKGDVGMEIKKPKAGILFFHIDDTVPDGEVVIKDCNDELFESKYKKYQEGCFMSYMDREVKE